MKGVTILSSRKWKRDISQLKHLKTFHVPVALIAKCRVKDGVKRQIRITPERGRSVSARLTISSGCEILIPKVIQSILVGKHFALFEVLDWDHQQSKMSPVKIRIEIHENQILYPFNRVCQLDFGTWWFILPMDQVECPGRHNQLLQTPWFHIDYSEEWCWLLRQHWWWGKLDLGQSSLDAAWELHLQQLSFL